MMTSSHNSRGGTAIVGKNQGETVLAPEPIGRSINLRELGIQFRVSEEAVREISRVEARASRVMATSARFAFR